MNQDKMQYRGFEGSVNYDEDGHYFYGNILDIKEHICYAGYNPSELTKNFIEAVDMYFVTYMALENL